MIVSVSEFDSYSGNYENSQEATRCKQIFLQSAQEIVDGYLGYDSESRWSENPTDRPMSISLSILRIATLMLMEAGGNIGLTGKSFSDNSRTFVSYSNYRKYLQPLDSIREIKF